MLFSLINFSSLLVLSSIFTTSCHGAAFLGNKNTGGKALSFSGDSTGTIHIEAADAVNHFRTGTAPTSSSTSLESWIASSDCIPAILGGNGQISQREDGLWNNQQPSFTFSGLNFKPVYVHNIDRPNSTELNVDIVDAHTIVDSQSCLNRAAVKVMERSIFEGNSHISIAPDKTGWIVTVKNSFGVKVPLPKYFLLPPGMNSMWRGIMEGACKKQSATLLENMKESYTAWVSSKQQQEQQKRKVDEKIVKI